MSESSCVNPPGLIRTRCALVDKLSAQTPGEKNESWQLEKPAERLLPSPDLTKLLLASRSQEHLVESPRSLQYHVVRTARHPQLPSNGNLLPSRPDESRLLSSLRSSAIHRAHALRQLLQLVDEVEFPEIAVMDPPCSSSPKHQFIQAFTHRL